MDPTPRSRALAEKAGVEVPPAHKKTPRVFAKDLTEDQAASMIQGMYRSHKARHMMRKLLATAVEKIWDEENKLFYYVNKKTGEVTWDKPKILGTDDLDPTPRSRFKAENAGVKVPPRHAHTPRVLAKDLTIEQAAVMVQCAYRAKKAREVMIKKFCEVYQKAYDGEAKMFYYFNSVTGDVTWTKPYLLGSIDLELTPRSKADAVRDGLLPPSPRKSPRVHAVDMTREQATIMLQNCFRSKRAMRLLRKMVADAYECDVDEATGSTFYTNKKTGEASWAKPKALGNMDLEEAKKLVVDSSMDSSVDSSTAVPSAVPVAPVAAPVKMPVKPKTPRFRAEDLTKDEAAVHIQGAWRSHRARQLLRQLVSGVYKKGIDPATGKFFYYNSKTGESIWTKPAALGDDDIEMSARTKIEAKNSGLLDHITPRFTSTDLTKDEAAAHIQQAWRTFVARKRFKALVSGVWTKGYDEKKDSFYYFNDKTGVSSWEKPSMLHDIDLDLTPRSEMEAIKARKLVVKPKTPRFRAANLNPEDAAMHIQGAWRAHHARQLLRQLVSGVYTKGIDPATGKFFYYNSKTGESIWTKPAALGDDDIEMSARTKIEAKNSGLLDHITPRFTSTDLTKDEAAAHIQQAWRTFVARKRFKALVSGVWTKGYDEKKDSFYYFNDKTGVSSWEKPSMLHDIDLDLTPRSEMEAIKARKLVVKPKTPRFRAANLNPEDAAMHIQGAWRAHRARVLLKQLVSGVYKKGFDSKSGQYFYTNSKTGESIWKKPAALGDDDVEVTARSKLEAKKMGVLDHITPRFTSLELTSDQAAIHIQMSWRHYKARCLILNACQQAYKKKYDEKKKATYYVNSKTGESSWIKPAVLEDSDLVMSPRSTKFFEAHKTGEEADRNFDKLKAAATASKPKVTTEPEAAQVIQKWYRACIIRANLHKLIENVYTKGFDPTTNEFYYYNKKTGTSLWKKPSVLGNATPRLTPRSNALAKSAHKIPPRRTAAQLTESEAAFMIQSMYRIRRDFFILQGKAELVWQKGYDPELDVFFYWNRQTRESQWNKPFSLGSFDLELTPRSMIGAKRAGRIMKKPKRWNYKEMKPEDAAIVLQSWWRGYIGRKNMCERVREVIYRCYDVNSKNFFWYNSRTRASTWHEPILLRRIPGIGDLPLTPRSMMLELHDRTQVRRAQRKAERKTANEMTKKEAAHKIQGMYRSWVSRFRIRAILRSIYEKLYDAHRGTYYYYNHRSGQSSWYKPTLLGSSDIRRSFVHSGTLRPEEAMKAALEAAKFGGYTIGEVQLMQGE